MKTPKIWKICVIGDRYVGKTALIKRYVFNTFAEETKETIESKAFRKKAGDTLLMIWDVSVYEKHVERILSGAKAILILGDITRGETYKTMRQIANFIDEPNEVGILSFPYGRQLYGVRLYKIGYFLLLSFGE